MVCPCYREMPTWTWKKTERPKNTMQPNQLLSTLPASAWPHVACHLLSCTVCETKWGGGLEDTKTPLFCWVCREVFFFFFFSVRPTSGGCNVQETSKVRPALLRPTAHIVLIHGVCVCVWPSFGGIYCQVHDHIHIPSVLSDQCHHILLYLHCCLSCEKSLW